MVMTWSSAIRVSLYNASTGALGQDGLELVGQHAYFKTKYNIEFIVSSKFDDNFNQTSDISHCKHGYVC